MGRRSTGTAALAMGIVAAALVGAGPAAAQSDVTVGVSETS
jgi:hypothetical protein